jgi:hypothetical protein
MRMLIGLACKGRFIYNPCILQNYYSILISNRETFAQIVHNQ